jgi:hypothetical protein
MSTKTIFFMSFMLLCVTKSDDALYEQQVHTPAMLCNHHSVKLKQLNCLPFPFSSRIPPLQLRAFFENHGKDGFECFHCAFAPDRRTLKIGYCADLARRFLSLVKRSIPG